MKYDQADCITKKLRRPKPKADYQKTSDLADYIRLRSLSVLNQCNSDQLPMSSFKISHDFVIKTLEPIFFALSEWRTNVLITKSWLILKEDMGNWSELHSQRVTSYKIQTLVQPVFINAYCSLRSNLQTCKLFYGKNYCKANF